MHGVWKRKEKEVHQFLSMLHAFHASETQAERIIMCRNVITLAHRSVVNVFCAVLLCMCYIRLATIMASLCF